MITTTRERVLDDDGSNWVTTTCYYDNELRIIQVKRQYPANRVTVTGNRYDFTGNVLQAKEWQTTGGTTVSMEQEFTRDARGRSLSTRQRVNDGEWVTVNELEHDGLGRLAAKRLHGGIDSIAYAYNARGWTTGIHGKNFKETLHYTDPPAALGVPARYNGNIAATMWQHGTGERQAYGYDYDGLDRLANAHHGRGTTTITRTNEYSVTGITHDKNGNILTLSRRANGNTVDDLAYRYSGNQLMNVHDASGHAAGYDNTGALTADRYLYDANGNMTRDLNNGITAVSYNFLNLPRQV
jgi:phage tail protein X